MLDGNVVKLHGLELELPELILLIIRRHLYLFQLALLKALHDLLLNEAVQLIESLFVDQFRNFGVILQLEGPSFVAKGIEIIKRFLFLAVVLRHSGPDRRRPWLLLLLVELGVCSRLGASDLLAEIIDLLEGDGLVKLVHFFVHLRGQLFLTVNIV